MTTSKLSWAGSSPAGLVLIIKQGRKSGWKSCNCGKCVPTLSLVLQPRPAGSSRGGRACQFIADDFGERLGGKRFADEVAALDKLGVGGGGVAGVTAGENNFEPGFLGEQLGGEFVAAHAAGHDDVGQDE